MKVKQFFIFVLLMSLFPARVWSYNFLYIHPTTGESITWESGSKIRYYLDPGGLAWMTSDQVLILLKEAMKVWERATPLANPPTFEFAGMLPEDVNGTNYQKYVSLFPCYTDDLASCPSDAQKELKTVILFDEDGSIRDKELCRIGGCSAVAGARVFSGTSGNPGNIVQGILVLGRDAAGGSEQNGAPLFGSVGIMVHELGHLLGLAHTVVNQQVVIENLWNDGENTLPTMMSIIFPDIEGTGQKYQATLSPDDLAGISTLYPSDTFSQNTGMIKGQVMKSDGTPMMHVNVIARNVDDPLCEAYSFLSGRDCESSASECAEAVRLGIISNNGYVISSLPPGTYTIEVEEVADDNLGLTLAPGLLPDEDIFGDAEFWNETDQNSESNILSSTITLVAGETRENIDIILNRNIVTDDRIKYLPFSTYTKGPDTRCQPTTVDYPSLVGATVRSANSSTENRSSGGCSLIQ